MVKRYIDECLRKIYLGTLERVERDFTPN